MSLHYKLVSVQYLEYDYGPLSVNYYLKSLSDLTLLYAWRLVQNPASPTQSVLVIYNYTKTVVRSGLNQNSNATSAYRGSKSMGGKKKPKNGQ